MVVLRGGHRLAPRHVPAGDPVTVTLETADVPYFDISDPAFSVSSREVLEARERSWFARTPFGLAVIRYDEVSALLKDRRLRQGIFAWPAQNGIEEGLLAEWWSEMMLSKAGDDHRRLRKLGNPAFSRTLIERMVPEFQVLANELIDGYADAGNGEFVSQFAEPYAARVLCKLIGMDEDRWHDLARWSTDIGLAFGVTIREDLERIETALASLYAVSDELIAERRSRPGPRRSGPGCRRCRPARRRSASAGSAPRTLRPSPGTARSP